MDARARIAPAAPAFLGLELERAQLAARQRGPPEGVVLFAREQVPEQHAELSGGRDERDLRSAARAHALIEGAQRAGRPDRDPGGLAEHVARFGRALL